jgi:hypothetical protein
VQVNSERTKEGNDIIELCPGAWEEPSPVHPWTGGGFRGGL